MAASRPYCLTYSEHITVGLYVDGPGHFEPWSMSLWSADERAEYVHTYDADSMASAVVAQLQRHGNNSILDVRACVQEAGTGTQWFTNICRQLEDNSLNIRTLDLDCNTQLPLDQLLLKIAACEVVTVFFGSPDHNPPQVLDNLDMLQRLSQQLTTKRIQYVEVGHEDAAERQQQLRALFTHASQWPCVSLCEGDNWGRSALMPELIATHPRTVRMLVTQMNHLDDKMQVLRQSKDSIRSLELTLFFNCFATDAHLQTLLETLRSMHQLREFRLLFRCIDFTQRITAQVKPIVGQLAERGVQLALDVLHVDLGRTLFQLDHGKFGADTTRQQLRDTLTAWQPTILEGSLTCEAEGYQPLCEELTATLLARRTALRTVVHQLLFAHRISEANIAEKVLHYVHQCFNT